MKVFIAKWERFLVSPATHKSWYYESGITAESREDAKRLILKHYGPAEVEEILYVGEVDPAEGGGFNHPGFFLTKIIS